MSTEPAENNRKPLTIWKLMFRKTENKNTYLWQCNLNIQIERIGTNILFFKTKIILKHQKQKTKHNLLEAKSCQYWDHSTLVLAALHETKNVIISHSFDIRIIESSVRGEAGVGAGVLANGLTKSLNGARIEYWQRHRWESRYKHKQTNNNSMLRYGTWDVSNAIVDAPVTFNANSVGLPFLIYRFSLRWFVRQQKNQSINQSINHIISPNVRANAALFST